jgi:hypothetical protein
MVDSRAKGSTAELKGRDLLRKITGLRWERIPASGALDPIHGLKGDLYVPNKDNKFCVEVKHYKDDHLTSKLLTSKNPQLIEWWKQAVRQGEQVNKDPLLMFKFDRSKWFIGLHTEYFPDSHKISDWPVNSILIPDHHLVVGRLEEMIEYWEEEDWINA